MTNPSPAHHPPQSEIPQIHLPAHARSLSASSNWWIKADLGIYYAWGRHGQKIMVAPEYDLVVAFTAHVPDDGYDPEFELFRDYILPSIIDSPYATTPVPVLEILAVSGIGVLVIVAIVRYRRPKTL